MTVTNRTDGLQRFQAVANLGWVPTIFQPRIIGIWQDTQSVRKHIFERRRGFTAIGKSQRGCVFRYRVGDVQARFCRKDRDFGRGHAFGQGCPTKHRLVCNGLSARLGDAIPFGKGDLAPVDHGNREADNVFICGEPRQPGIQTVIVYELCVRCDGKRDHGQQARDGKAWKPHWTSSNSFAQPQRAEFTRLSGHVKSLGRGETDLFGSGCRFGLTSNLCCLYWPLFPRFLAFRADP